MADQQATPRYDSGCPSDAHLRGLLDDALPTEEQQALVAHLDACHACRSRLESAAGAADVWSEAARHLRHAESAERFESETLAETLQSMQAPTQTVRLPRIDGPADDLEPRDKPDRIGRLGRYEIVAMLGQGGMGVVYKAFDESLRRHVAVKLIRSPLAGEAKVRERFRREARAAAAIRDEHVVAIHHIEETDGNPYLVMEYVEGVSLEHELRQGQPMDWPQIARIGFQIALGLAAAHARGLVHRDVKPANILLEKETRRVKISDFGLARSLEDAGVTQSGCIAGTPEYIAPEHAAGGSVDHRADLFSLGSVLYAMCTGTPPFAAESPLAVLRRTREDSPRPIGDVRPDVPKELCDVVSKLLAKDPDARFATATDAAAALAAIGNSDAATEPMALSVSVDGRSSRVRTGWAVAASVMILALGFIVSEVSGLTGVVASLAGVGARQEQPKQATAEKPEAAAVAAKDDAPPAETAATQSRPPNNVAPPAAAAAVQPERVQIVTPDQLMRERIQAEKDQVERAHSPALVRMFQGHTGPVADVAFTPDGKSLLSCSGWPDGDRTLRQWDAKTGQQTRLFDVSNVPRAPAFSGSREAPGEFHSLAITPDGKTAITTGTGGAVCVWDMASGKMTGKFTGHTGTVYSVAISPDGRTALTGGRDQVARLWDIGTQGELLTMPGHKSYIRTVALSPDGRHALTGGLGEVLRYWDLDAAKQIGEMKAGDGWVWSAAFSPDGSRAASASGTMVHLWDLATGKEIRRFRGHGGDVTSVAFSPDGRFLLSGAYDQTVRLWSVDTGEQLATYLGHRDWVWTVAFSPDGSQAVSAGGGRKGAAGGYQSGIDCAVRLWKLPPTKPRVAK